MRLQRYRFTIKYKKVTSLHLADTLSRAALPTPVHARITGFEVFRAELTEESGTHNPRLTETTESRLRDETKKDEHLSKLMTTIAQGWSDNRNHNHYGRTGLTGMSYQSTIWPYLQRSTSVGTTIYAN